MAAGTQTSLLRHNDTTHIPNQPSKTSETSISITELPPTPPEYTDQVPLDNTLVLNPTLITQDFDLLRFEAAALSQIPTTSASAPATNHPERRSDPDPSPIYSTHLISSPYNNPAHYLDLTTLPLPSLLFAKALTALKPVLPTYATAPYTSALNFPAVLSFLRRLIISQANNNTSDGGFTWRATSFYVVVFRSRLKGGVDNEWLYELDYESHREACESGGLLKYWFGKGDGEGRNLATCIWHSREDAYRGGLGPWHRKARAAGRELYERIVFSTHRFTVLDGAEGFRFEDWKE
ncbi:Nn.00g103980.m01.CDS01 [Neocucurbitaria sp. VM-36]